MGFFDNAVNTDISGQFKPQQAGYSSLVNYSGNQMGSQQDTLMGHLNDMWNTGASGGYNTPARAAILGRDPEFQNWWESLRGGEGTTNLKDEQGRPLTSYMSIANEGMMTPEQKYAVRERQAAQGRSLTGSIMDQMRRGGTSGWGSNPAAMLAAQKQGLGSLRSGAIEANSSIADQTNKERQWGYGQMEGAQNQMQAAEDRMNAERRAAASSGRNGFGMGEQLQLLNAMGNLGGTGLDWAAQTNQGLSGWGSNVGQSAQASGQGAGSSTASRIGGAVAAAAPAVIAAL